MTISSQARTAGPFACNGSTTVFPFAFKVFSTSDVAVVFRTDVTGVETTLVLGVDYTVSLNTNQDANPGGSISTLVAFAAGSTLTLTSKVAYLQPTDLTNQGGFYPKVITTALDRLTIFAQQILNIANRALRFPISDGNLDGTLPGKDQRKGTVLAFDATTGLPVVGPSIADTGTVGDAVAAIQTVADNIADVNTVADYADEVADFNARYQGPKTTDPTVRNDGSALQAGDLYFNTTNGRLRAYTGSRWSEANTGSVAVQRFTGDGTTVNFTLNASPDNENVVQVYIGGVYQSKTEYDITGAGANILTFTAAPPNGAAIEAVTFSVLPLGVVGDSQVQLTGGGTLADYSAFVRQTAVRADGRPAITKLTVGDEVLTAPAVRDDVVVGKTITTLTDSHAFADRTIISSFSDAGTYGTFDATTQYAHATGTANHLYTFQGRGKKTGAGNLDNYASFYSQPNLSGGAVTDMHHVRVYDNAGNSTVTNQHGLHIRPLSQGVNNYAIFSWGDTPSIHVGKFTVGVSTIDNTAAIAAVNKVNMTGIRQYGFKSDCGANSAALTDYAAYYARVNTSGTGYTLPYGSGLVVEDANLSAGTTVGAVYGFWIKNQTKGTVNAAMRLEVSKAANKWNLYATGDADNYLKGNIGIDVFVPTARLEIRASQTGSELAPIKIQPGALLPTPQDGALEYNGTNLYFTIGGVRKIVNLT